MPDRIVRASILDSKAFNELSDEAEVLYRRLLSVVDDFGCYEADPELIQAKCFWRKVESWPTERITAGLSDICKPTNADGSVLMRLYIALGKRLLRIYKLGKPRARKLRYPLPEGDTCGHLPTDACTCMQTPTSANIRNICLQEQTSADICMQTQTSVGNVACTTTTTTTNTTTNKDLKKEGYEKHAAQWEEFCRLYPTHKFDEVRAGLAWAAADDPDAIIDGLKAWIPSEAWKDRGGRFVNHASRFISEGVYKMRPQAEDAAVIPPKPWKPDW